MTEATSLHTSILFGISGAYCAKIGTILRSIPTPVSQSKQCKLNFELVSSQVPWVPEAFRARFPVSSHFFRLDRNLSDLYWLREVKWIPEATVVETFDQANYNSILEYNVALITLLTWREIELFCNSAHTQAQGRNSY